ncbi:MAG: hypothetical protein J6L05_04140 [Ruminococcus sp.]|nr:hypothetical protein [Ruminococcus sp.]
MKILKYIAVSVACVMCVGAFGCGKKNSEISGDSSEVNTTAVTTEEASVTGTDGEKQEISASTTEKTVEEEPVTEASSAENTTENAIVTETEAVTESLTETTEAKNEQPLFEKGYTDSFEAVQAFYTAYLNHDAASIYNMFYQPEITAYGASVEELLEGRKAEDVFTKQAVLTAISDSMDNIDEIMAFYENRPEDEWVVNLTADNLSQVAQEDIDAFNASLGISFTNAVETYRIFYENTVNGEAFTGNSCAFLEKDGRWYLSFSIMMRSDLINFMEIY